MLSCRLAVITLLLFSPFSTQQFAQPSPEKKPVPMHPGELVKQHNKTSRGSEQSPRDPAPPPSGERRVGPRGDGRRGGRSSTPPPFSQPSPFTMLVTLKFESTFTVTSVPSDFLMWAS